MENEKWYDITSTELLKGYKISNFGRVLGVKGIILKNINGYPKCKYRAKTYNIYKDLENHYFAATDLMVRNIPELKQENRYMGKCMFKDGNPENICVDNIIPVWSKLDKDDDWKYIKEFDIYINRLGEVVDAYNERLLRPSKDANGYRFVYRMVGAKKVKVTLSRWVHVLFNLKLDDYEGIIYDRRNTIVYKDGNKSNLDANNLSFKNKIA